MADSDVRLTRGDDIRSAERRPYEVERHSLEAPSSIIWWIDCPWCRREVKAYLWSLSGCGKRCSCGALFYSLGTAWKRLPEQQQPQPSSDLMNLDKLSKPWKKAVLHLPAEFEHVSVEMPEGVEVVQVALKLYGEGLPERFRTKEGEAIPQITLKELADLAQK